jgi:hypothetical protein
MCISTIWVKDNKNIEPVLFQAITISIAWLCTIIVISYCCTFTFKQFLLCAYGVILLVTLPIVSYATHMDNKRRREKSQREKS